MPGPVLLLPGMMCDERLFACQTGRLKQDTGGQISVLTPPLDTASSMTELAANLLTTAPPSFSLCGLSMGGILAMEIMAQAPHRVTRLPSWEWLIENENVVIWSAADWEEIRQPDFKHESLSWGDDGTAGDTILLGDMGHVLLI